MWYADDAAAVGKVSYLRAWWDKLSKDYGYFPNAKKTWLVTKSGSHSLGKNAFSETGVNISGDGRLYLGAAIGSTDYVERFVESKVSTWTSLVNDVAAIALTQPHAAYSARLSSVPVSDHPRHQ